LTQNWIYIRRCKLEKKSLNFGESIQSYSWKLQNEGFFHLVGVEEFTQEAEVQLIAEAGVEVEVEVWSREPTGLGIEVGGHRRRPGSWTSRAGQGRCFWTR